MKVGKWMGWLMVPLVLATLGGTVYGDAKKEPPQPAAKAPAKPDADEGAGKQYWIGIMALPVDPLLKKHLKIETGVVVQHVVPDSPAVKAGIKQDDILLQFGDAKAGSAEELAAAVQANRDRQAKVTLLREGRQQTVQVTPAVRPEDTALPALPRDRNWGRVQEWLDRLEKGQTVDDPFRMFFFRPGIVMPPGAKGHRIPGLRGMSAAIQLPPNTSITVSKTDDGPAKITVKKDGQQWEVTEEELDKLPEDVRQIVQGLLGGGFGFSLFGDGFRIELEEDRPAAKPGSDPPAKPDADAKPGRAKAEVDGVMKQLEELNRQLQENQKRLQGEMERLRRQVERLPRKET